MDFNVLLFMLFLYFPLIIYSSIIIFLVMSIMLFNSYRKKNDLNTRKIITKIIILIALAFFSYIFYFLSFLTNTICFYVSIILLIIYLITSIIFIILTICQTKRWPKTQSSFNIFKFMIKSITNLISMIPERTNNKVKFPN